MSKLISYLLKTSSSLVLLIVGSMLIALFYYSLPAFTKYGITLYLNPVWDPARGIYGGAAAIYGSILVTSIAMLIAIPLSIGFAVFIHEFSGKARGVLQALNDLLAGFPTVLFGLWGLCVLGPTLNNTIFLKIYECLNFIPLFSTMPIDGSYLLAGIVLAIMIIPFASSLIREAYMQVPINIIETAYSLGLSRWDVIRIRLSYIKHAILGAISLAIGRGIGETVAVAMTIGSVIEISPSLFAPGITVPALIVNQFGAAYTRLEQATLFALAFSIFIIGLFFIVISRIFIRKVVRTYG